MRPELSFLIALVLGIHALVTGIRYIRGSYKAPYFAQASKTLYAEMGISLGLTALIIAILTAWSLWLPPLPPSMGVLLYVGLFAILLNWLLGILGKHKPQWVIWLEANTDQQLQDSLRYHAQSQGLAQWEEKMQTQKDLEAWVKKVSIGLAKEKAKEAKQ